MNNQELFPYIPVQQRREKLFRRIEERKTEKAPFLLYRRRKKKRRRNKGNNASNFVQGVKEGGGVNGKKSSLSSLLGPQPVY